MTAAETKAFLDLVAAEEAAPTGPAGEDGVATVNYAQFVADGEALLTKAGAELPDKAVYTTDGVLDEGDLRAGADHPRQGHRRDLHRRRPSTPLPLPTRTSTSSAIPVGTGAFKFVEFKPGESIEYAANEDYFLGAPDDQADVHPDHQG